MKSSLSLKLTLRIASVIFSLVLFFIIYNNFLLDKSLAALDVSLQGLKTGETLGISLLLNINSATEITKSEFDESRLAKLDYLNSTIFQRGGSKDAQIILSDLIDEKKRQRPDFLRALDAPAMVLKRGISNTFARGGGEQQIKRDLKEAADAHNKGDFIKAKSLYTNIIASGGISRYIDIAKALLLDLNKQLVLEDEYNKLTSELKRLVAPDELARTYFKLGLLETQLLNFNKARDYFNKVLEVAPTSDLAARSKFYLGWVNKQFGDFTNSVKYFTESIQESKEKKIIISSKFQIADTFKRQGEFEKAAELFRDISHKHADSKIAPVVLTFSKFTYLFDLKDVDKSNEIAAELIREHPGSALLESSRQQLELKESPLEQLTKGKEVETEDALSRIWSSTPILGQALRLAEDVTAWYAIYMIEGSIDQALQKNIGKGETLVIEVDQEFLTNYVRKGLQQAASRTGFTLSGFMLQFPKKDQVKIGGFVKIGPANFEFSVLCGMIFEKHIEMDLIKGEYNPVRWVILTALEGRLGQFKVPMGLANRMMGKANRVFNQKQIFEINDFSLTEGRIYFAGPLRFTQEELKLQRNLLDQYIKLYK